MQLLQPRCTMQFATISAAAAAAAGLSCCRMDALPPLFIVKPSFPPRRRRANGGSDCDDGLQRRNGAIKKTYHRFIRLIWPAPSLFLLLVVSVSILVSLRSSGVSGRRRSSNNSKSSSGLAHSFRVVIQPVYVYAVYVPVCAARVISKCLDGGGV